MTDIQYNTLPRKKYCTGTENKNAPLLSTDSIQCAFSLPPLPIQYSPLTLKQERYWSSAHQLNVCTPHRLLIDYCQDCTKREIEEKVKQYITPLCHNMSTRTLPSLLSILPAYSNSSRVPLDFSASARYLHPSSPI